MAPERICFTREVETPDGMNGSDTMTETVYSCTAEVEVMKPSRLLEANQIGLRQGYRMRIWVTTQFEPKVGDTILYRDETLSIQGYRYTDELKTRYEITALERANGAGN